VNDSGGREVTSSDVEVYATETGFVACDNHSLGLEVHILVSALLSMVSMYVRAGPLGLFNTS
jgi:hypothetical protein